MKSLTRIFVDCVENERSNDFFGAEGTESWLRSFREQWTRCTHRPIPDCDPFSARKKMTREIVIVQSATIAQHREAVASRWFEVSMFIESGMTKKYLHQFHQE